MRYTYNISILIIGPDLETVHERAEWIPLDIPIYELSETNLLPFNTCWIFELSVPVQAFQHHAVQQHCVTFCYDRVFNYKNI